MLWQMQEMCQKHFYAKSITEKELNLIVLLLQPGMYLS